MVALIVSPELSHLWVPSALGSFPIFPHSLFNLPTLSYQDHSNHSGTYLTYEEDSDLHAKSFSIDAPGDICQPKKTSGIILLSKKKSWHQFEAHILSQLWPVHMIRTFKGIIHLMATPQFFADPNGAQGIIF